MSDISTDLLTGTQTQDIWHARLVFGPLNKCDLIWHHYIVTHLLTIQWNSPFHSINLFLSSSSTKMKKSCSQGKWLSFMCQWALYVTGTWTQDLWHRAKAPTMQLVRSDKLSDSNTPLNQVTLFCPHSNKGGH